MDSDFWTSRLAAAKRQFIHRHHNHNNHLNSQLDRLNFDDFEVEEEVRPDFPCPYCYEDFDIASLCSHLEDEHSCESRVTELQRRENLGIFFKMKNCELCKCTARIYCESDQASLCWTCDAKVHSANFLVARHLRRLLCHSCKSPTPWSASGEKIGRTVSLCERCVEGCDGRKEEGEGEEREESQGGNDDDFESGSDSDSEEDDEGDDRLDEDEDEGDDGDNQVVPFSSTLPPPAASSSSTEEFSTGDIDVSSKQSHENFADFFSADELRCSSPRWNNQTISGPAAASCIGGGEDAFVDSSFRPFKIRKIEAASVQHTLGGSRTAVTVEALERFHQQDMTSSSSSSSGSKECAAVYLDLPGSP